MKKENPNVEKLTQKMFLPILNNKIQNKTPMACHFADITLAKNLKQIKSVLVRIQKQQTYPWSCGSGKL